MELLSAVQGFEFRRPLKTSPILEAVIDSVRQVAPFAKEDRIFSTDIENLRTYLREGTLEQVSEDAATSEKINLNGDYSAFSL